MVRKVSILQTIKCSNYSFLNWPSTTVLSRSKAERSRVGCTTVACSEAISKPAKKDRVASSLRDSIFLVAPSSDFLSQVATCSSLRAGLLEFSRCRDVQLYGASF